MRAGRGAVLPEDEFLFPAPDKHRSYQEEAGFADKMEGALEDIVEFLVSASIFLATWI